MKKYFIFFLISLHVWAYAPWESFAFTPGPSKQVPTSGTLQVTTTFSVDLVNSQGDILPTQPLTFTAPTSEAQVVTAGQLIKVKFSDNHSGFQAIIISTNNRMQGAKPRFSPQFRSATGAGLVGKSEVADANTNHGAHAGEKITAAPLQWTVFDQLSRANNYVMTGDPRIEFYVIDKQQVVATEVDTSEDPGHQPPPPFDSVVGAALIIGGIAGQSGYLADAPNPSSNGDHRVTNDGEVFVKMAANYRDQIGQAYATSTLTLEMVTI